MHLKLFFEYAWLKTHYEKLILIKKFVYKRYFVKFSNNIKLYKHVRTKHAKKSKQLFFLTSNASNVSNILITTSHTSITMFSTFVILFSILVALSISFFSFAFIFTKKFILLTIIISTTTFKKKLIWNIFTIKKLKYFFAHICYFI